MGIPFRCKLGKHTWVTRELENRKILKCKFCGTGKTEFNIDDVGREHEAKGDAGGG